LAGWILKIWFGYYDLSWFGLGWFGWKAGKVCRPSQLQDVNKITF